MVAKVTSDKEKLTLQYAESMCLELCRECNFGLEGRGQSRSDGGEAENDAGYYFSNGAWRSAFQQITQIAYSALSNKSCPLSMDEERWNWCHKAAYRELVHLSIIRYHQIQVSVDLAKQYPDREIHILQSSVCKESMDRGGKTNACLLWALGEESPELYKNVFAAFYARALLSRGRLILADRMEPMLALTLVMEQAEIQQFLQRLTELLGARSGRATPAISNGLV
jgi:hypothetical protein